MSAYSSLRRKRARDSRHAVNFESWARKAKKQLKAWAEQQKPTYWNGEPARCTRVRVIVGESAVETWWCAGLKGTERWAIRVEYGDSVFYLDDDEGTDPLGKKWPAGMGWHKVTVGCGYPDFPAPQSAGRMRSASG